MTWKSLEEVYLKESALKEVPLLPRQQVHREASAEEVIKLIKDLDSQGLLQSGEDLEVVKKFLARKPFVESIFQYLDSKNLTENTIREGDVRKFILEIISNNNDTAAFAEYIKNPVTLSSIGSSGMLVEKMMQITKMSSDTIRGLINLIGTESGRGVGRGEMACATIFSDVKMSSSKGDLDWDGKYLEVKGTAARLGKRDRAYSNFQKSQLGILAKKYDKSDKRIDTLVANIADEPGLQLSTLYTALLDFIRVSYPHSSIQFPREINLTNPLEVRKAITKIMISNYAEHEGLESFIFINTGNTRFFGRYIIFTKEQIPQLVDKNLVKAGAINILDLDPSIGTI